MLLADEKSTKLILEELTDKDEGQYKCEARNPGGVADAIMNVMVDGKSREVLASFCLHERQNRAFLVNYVSFVVGVLREHCSRRRSSEINGNLRCSDGQLQ